MNEKDWLDAATGKIRFRPDRKAVRRELEDHLADLREASGLEEDAALAAMGDPAEIAEELGRIHRPWLGYLWRVSQIALAGAAVLYCLVLTILTVRGTSYLLPGERISGYRHWLGSQAVTAPYIVLEEREFPSGATVRTGGYTIRVDRVVLREEGAQGELPQRNLYIDLDIGLSRWEEQLHLWYACSDGRTNAGPMEKRDYWSVSSCWGFWQKSMLKVMDLPEDAEWVELDLGRGELRRTLHIDLGEEAEA